MQNVHRHVQTRNLGGLTVKRGGLKEIDLNEIVAKVQGVLAAFMPGKQATAVSITPSQHEVKILADSDRMVRALLSIVGSALEELLAGSALSLTTTRVDFTYRSILDGTYYQYGACASLVISGEGIDGWGRLCEQMFASKTGNGKYFHLAAAYSIIRQHHGSIRMERVPGHRTAITFYLPLARQDGHPREV